MTVCSSFIEQQPDGNIGFLPDEKPILKVTVLQASAKLMCITKCFYNAECRSVAFNTDLQENNCYFYDIHYVQVRNMISTPGWLYVKIDPL